MNILVETIMQQVDIIDSKLVYINKLLYQSGDIGVNVHYMKVLE